MTRIARNTLSSLIPPLIPILAVALEYPLWQFGLLVSLFSLGSGMGQAPVGHLADRYDRKYILPTGVFVAGASYLLFAFAPQISYFLPNLTVMPFDSAFVIMCVSMLMCGLGNSVVNPTIYPMITANVREKNKGTVMGIFGSAAKFGDSLAPIVIGLLILVLIWEAIITLLGVFGVFFAILLFFLLGDFDTSPAESQSNPDGDGDGADSIWDGDRRKYLYPMGIILAFFITRGFSGRGLRTFIPAFIVGVYGYSLELFGTSFEAESVANFYFSTLLIIAGFTQIVVGYFLGRVDPRTVIITFTGLTSIGILCLAYLGLSPIALLAVLLVIGIGQWGLNPARDLLISEITPPAREGRSFGYLWTASHVTGAIIPTIIGYIADTVGLRHSFGVLAVFSFLALSFIVTGFTSKPHPTNITRNRIVRSPV